MLAAIRQYFRVAQFNSAAGDILNCPPVECDPSKQLTLVSQLRQRDVLMYLLALKSFASYLTPSHVVVLDDGSLGGKEQALLRRQIPAVEILPITAITTAPCPRGGTWERLLHILERSQHSYVIQLDADTLSLADPSEVRQCVTDNRSFTLGTPTPTGREIVRLDQASDFIHKHLPNSQHVQVLAERALGRFPNKERFRYVRGNSGFTGFARGACSRSLVEDFSQAMEALIGAEKWREWGSEQVSSNFAVANSPSPMVLPQPHYAFFGPKMNYHDAVFLHFIGTHRYRSGIYAGLAREVIAHLRTLPL